MNQVWKFPLAMIGVQTVEMPWGARILKVEPQMEGVCLWALCNCEAEKVPRTIVMVGTGREMPIGALQYISTFQMRGGALVFHAFEAVRTPL